jgi:hypothetical protein
VNIKGKRAQHFTWESKENFPKKIPKFFTAKKGGKRRGGKTQRKQG